MTDDDRKADNDLLLRAARVLGWEPLTETVWKGEGTGLWDFADPSPALPAYLAQLLVERIHEQGKTVRLEGKLLEHPDEERCIIDVPVMYRIAAALEVLDG